MAKNRNQKVVKFRKPFLNIDMIVFGVIFIYVIIYVIVYFSTSHIVRYEVREGALATDNTYKGIALRQEKVMYAQDAGYINFYAREGERVAKNALVYIMDETGRLSENLAEMNQGENKLSNKELSEFKSEIVNFVHSYDPQDYESAYNFRYSLKNTVLKLAGSNMMSSIEGINGLNGVDIINYEYAPHTGIVSYWTDGYEEYTAKDVTEACFNNPDYTKNQHLANNLLAVGDAAYKLCDSENWSIVIPMEANAAAKLLEEEYVKVKFLKNQYTSWAQVKLSTNADGNCYVELLFNNSMITFINDRFLDIELLLQDEKGLKIPVSSIVQKEFFLIPERFVDSQNNNGSTKITRQCYLDDGSISSEVLDIEVYNFDNETNEYYLDSSLLNAGDILYKLDGQETFTVSKRATLIGVYNINKGYADFKQINILYQNDEYAIVKSNTKYGLNVFDYIVLNADSVKDNQFIE